MTTRLSIGTGNFTTAGTWAACDSTTELDSEANNTALTTSNVSSATFTPGAITVDAMAVKIFSRAASPTGTMTVELFNSTDSTSTAIVTVNVSDIPSEGLCWFVLQFGSTLLTAGKAYLIRAKTSSSSQVNLYRNATAGNWSRQLRTTTTGAPAATDKLIVAGQWTAAATGSSYTVTMDNTATTSFGEVSANSRGTLTWGTSASTAYYLKMAGNLYANGGGTLSIATSGSRLDSTSSAVIEFDCGSNVQYGFEARGGTVTMYGATKTRQTLLTADVAAAGTGITVQDTTGWAANDSLAFATTTRTSTESETKTVTSVTNSTTAVVAALTNAHSGTVSGSEDNRGEVLNLTCNVKIRGISTSLQGYVNIGASCSITLRDTEIYQMGSATALKRGINAATTAAGVCNIQYCAIHDFIVASSIGILTSSTATGVVFSNNVTYNIANIHISVTATSGTHTFDTNWCTLNVDAATMVMSFNDAGCTVTNNRASGSTASGILVTETAAIVATFTGNCSHGNANYGIYFQLLSGTSGTISGCKGWRNASAAGFFFQYCTGVWLVDTFTAWGNSTTGFTFLAATISGVFSSCLTLTGTTLTQSHSITLQNGAMGVRFKDGTFTSATSDVNIGNASVIQAVFINCTFNSTTTVNAPSNMQDYGAVQSYIAFDLFNTTAGDYRLQKSNGLIKRDTSIYDVTPSSARLTPNSASLKLSHVDHRFGVAASAAVTVTARVYKSAVGDGAAYNGNQPRLRQRLNDVAGPSSDATLATAAASTGSWETLTGSITAPTVDSIVEVYVDCDGTAGWVNVDEIKVS
jgi:hypothetical protein